MTTRRGRPVKPEERVIFSSVVEGLLRHGLKGQVTPRLKERLRMAGLELDRPLLPAYPLNLWRHCLNLIAEELYPGVPRPEAFRRLATRHVEGYGSTLFGRAMYRILRLLGPRRVMLRMPETLRSTDNYTEARLVEKGPGAFELHLNSALDAPGYAETLFEGLLRLAGAQQPHAQLVHQDAEATTYLLTWKED